MNGWLDSPIESFKAAYNEAIEKWTDALSAFDAAYSEFVENEQYVHTSDDTRLVSQYDDAAGRVGLIQSTIQGVRDAMSSIGSFIGGVGSAIGLSGVQTARGMGFILPAIPWALVATITAGVAALYTVTNYMLSSNTAVANAKIAEQNILNSQQGLPLIPFIELQTAQSGGIFSGLSDTAKWLTYGILGYFALKLLEKK